MLSINLILRQNRSHNGACISILRISAAIAFLCFFAVATSYGQGCDMGNAYSYTDTWSQGGEADSDGDGIYDHNHINPNRPYAVGQGVVENDYNTCGHEYYTETTMTGPDGSTASGEGSASLEIIIDGQYFTESQLFYYCPIAGRSFESGFSSNFLDVTAINDVYYGYQRTYPNPPFFLTKWCIYRACADSDTHPANGCFDPDYWDLRDAGDTCAGGIRSTFAKVRVPFFGIYKCIEISHADLPGNPCGIGGVLP